MVWEGAERGSWLINNYLFTLATVHVIWVVSEASTGVVEAITSERGWVSNSQLISRYVVMFVVMCHGDNNIPTTSRV